MRFALCFLALALAGCAELGDDTTPGSDERVVRIVDFAYEPATLDVPVGTVVVWKHAGEAAHTATSGEAFDSGTMERGDEYRHAFSTEGTFTVRCEFHSQMTMKVTVG